MSVAEVMSRLESWGDEKIRARYVRDGAGENVFGVLLGKIRALAQELGTNHPLAHELWKTGNYEARVLACMLFDPKAIDENQGRELLEPLDHPLLADELVRRVLAESPAGKALQQRWMEAEEELLRRAGWKLLVRRIENKKEKNPDVDALFARIERELPTAPFRVKEGMNHCLVTIGVRLREHTDRAIALGERLGRWDTRPVPRGCTSSYAPEWIAAVLALRSGEKTEARKAMEAAKAANAAKKAAAAQTKKTPAAKKTKRAR